MRIRVRLKSLGIRRNVVLGVAVLAGFGCAPERKPTDPPNVVLIVLDTTRADHTSVYGYERDTTPGLRAFADEGVVFLNAYAPMGLTGPTHASLFTGQYPHRNGVLDNATELMPSHTTLAEFLRARGYTTTGIVSSFVIGSGFGFAQGFDEYLETFKREEASVLVDAWRGIPVSRGFDRKANYTADLALTWLKERDRPEPFFLFVHFFDPHSPYEPPEPYAARFHVNRPKSDSVARLMDLYDGEISFTDAQVTRVLEALEEFGYRENTLVVITSDHGEGLMQRGYVLHGLSLHEEELRVPLLMRWPASVPAGLRIAGPVTSADVFPTVAELIGFPLTGIEHQGESIAGEVMGEVAADRVRPLYFYRRHHRERLYPPELDRMIDGVEETPSLIYLHGEQFGVRVGAWKYIVAPNEGKQLLFQLERDPEELVNVFAQQSERAAKMHRQLETWMGQQPAAPTVGKTMSEEGRAALRALGYLE